MAKRIEIPATFYTDHCERGLPTPRALKRGRSITIDADDPAVFDLRDDALFYADASSTDAPAWLRRSAEALLTALRRHGAY